MGLFSFGGPCPREGRGIPFPYLAHAGAGGSCHSPCGLTGSPGSGTPARRRRNPAPQPPAMRAKGPSLLGPLRAALRLPPRRAGGERLGQGPRGAAGERPACRQPRLGRRRRRGAGGGYAGRRGRRQSRACKASAAGGAGRHGWPERRRPGRRGGRPHSPHTVGAGPPRSTYAAAGEGEEQSKARRAAPQGLGLALRKGAPEQRSGPT